MSPERWLRIESVFQTAIDLPAAERDAFLTGECGQDSELRGEVEKLLKSSDSAAAFIEVPVWTDSRFLNTSAKKEISNSLEDRFEDAARDNYLGSRIGAYRLTREIGRGGMGAVYLAERADGEFNQLDGDLALTQARLADSGGDIALALKSYQSAHATFVRLGGNVVNGIG